MVNKRRKVWWIVGSSVFVMLFALFYVGLWFLMISSGRLVCIEPSPKSVKLDGREMSMESYGCFILTPVWGTHVVNIEFDSGVKREVELYPRISEDDSTHTKITESSVESPNLDYKVIK